MLVNESLVSQVSEYFGRVLVYSLLLMLVDLGFMGVFWAASFWVGPMIFCCIAFVGVGLVRFGLSCLLGRKFLSYPDILVELIF